MADRVIPDNQTPEELAAQVEAEHVAARQRGIEQVEHWIHAGALLNVIKVILGHGNWLTFVDQHCPKSARSASRYMRIHTQRDKARQISHGMANVTLDRLDQQLGDPERKPRTRQPSPTPPCTGPIPLYTVSVIDDFRAQIKSWSSEHQARSIESLLALHAEIEAIPEVRARLRAAA